MNIPEFLSSLLLVHSKILDIFHLRLKHFYFHLSGSDVKIILFLPIQGIYYLSDLLICYSKTPSKRKSEILLLEILL